MVLAVAGFLLLSVSPAYAALSVSSVFSSDSSGNAKTTFTTKENVYQTIIYSGTGTINGAYVWIITSVPAPNGNFVGTHVTETLSNTNPTQIAWSAPTSAGTYYVATDNNHNGKYDSAQDKISAAFTVTSAATTLTVTCSPTTVDKNGAATTTISGTLTGASTGISGKSIALTYSSDGATWNPIGTATTAAGGAYSYDWTVTSAVPNGAYFVRATFTADSTYDGSVATTSGGDLLVVPEYFLGGLAALLACFGAFAVFAKRGSLSALRRRAA